MTKKPKPNSQRGLLRQAIIDALDLTVHRTVDMPKEVRQRILDTQPTADEIANGRWNDAS
jgi:hypothetical protein